MLPMKDLFAKNYMEWITAAHKRDGNKGFVTLTSLQLEARERWDHETNQDKKKRLGEISASLMNEKSTLRKVLNHPTFNGYLFEEEP